MFVVKSYTGSNSYWCALKDTPIQEVLGGLCMKTQLPFLLVFTVTAEQLWKGVLAETGAGARKGRGKRTKRKLKRDLNRGQNIGEGNMTQLCPLSISLRFSLC